MVNEKTKQELIKCLPSTGLPPHDFIASDKATVYKRTNQATIICPTIDGVKVPIILGAPGVYTPGDNGDVQGWKAEDLANKH